MEHLNRYDGIDPRVLKHIRATARRLARQHAVPGMDAQDLEQDLVLDLWCRMEAFDPARASFRTFAHRVIAHRVATLTSPTARRAAERATVPLDMPVVPGSDITFAEMLPAEPDDAAPDDAHGMRLDVARFVASLTPALRRCCDILLSENVAAAAEAAGLHRSSVYENAKRLKRQAIAAGLGAYFVAPRHFANRAGT